METAKIREYALLLREMDLTALEVRSDGSVRLERGAAARAESPAAAAVSADAAPAAAPAESGEMVFSPMVGVYYASPAENAEPFVTPGSHVRRGDVLCIIEAMKLMNEITAEYDGVVEETLAVNGAVVEFGQPLFRLRKERE
jgi:acetyl-CoA carboxylase biotin carboxyl carrier protein